MARADWEYQREAWENLVENKGLTQAELAQIIGVTERHVQNILGGQVQVARTRTWRKVKDGLQSRGIAPDGLFRKRFRNGQ